MGCECGNEIIVAKGLCKKCYNKSYNIKHSYKSWSDEQKKKNTERLKKYYKKPEVKEKFKVIWKVNNDKRIKKETCNILKKHAEDLRNDPEHLTTDFLQNMIGIKCKKDIAIA